jgi:hypothetical protein
MQGATRITPTDSRRAGSVERTFLDAAAAMRNSPWRTGCCERLPRRGTLLATGDIHDYPGRLEAIMMLADLDAGPDRHVTLHELIHGDRLVNRMDLSYRTLLRVADLVLAYPGQVHPLLANHEIAQCFRMRVSKGAGDQVQMFDEGLDFVFGDDAQCVADAINAFIRAMPLALRCDNGLFLAHSVPAEIFDPAELDRELGDADYASPRGVAWRFTWGRVHAPVHVDAVRAALGARLLVLGHVKAEMGAASPAPGVLVLNSDHEHGAVVPFDLAEDAPAADGAVTTMVPLGAYRTFRG